MATLTQLYTRLILELNRDDMGSGGELEQAKIDAVERAIELHADEAFWFNRKFGTATTSDGVATVSLPSGMRIPLHVSYNGDPLQKVPLEDIEALTDEGVPTKWAENEGVIQLWAVPDAAYTLKIGGIEDIGVPASGGATNAWTTTAYDLIVSTAKKYLCRGPLRDPEGAAMAAADEVDYLTKLRRETRRRRAVSLTNDIPIASGFNILTG